MPIDNRAYISARTHHSYPPGEVKGGRSPVYMVLQLASPGRFVADPDFLST